LPRGDGSWQHLNNLYAILQPVLEEKNSEAVNLCVRIVEVSFSS